MECCSLSGPVLERETSNGEHVFGPEDLAFLECLRWRTEREAKIILGEEFRRAPEKVEKRALEAAFDGDMEELRNLLDVGVWPECRNMYGDTLLSEASVGGQLEVVQFLLGIGANPNSHGRYRRTPVWRAAFNGHSEVVRTLLRFGGDPGEPDDNVGLPIDVCPTDELRAVLACWHMPLRDPVERPRRLSDSGHGRASSKEKTAIERREEERCRRKQLQQKDLEEAICEAERHVHLAQVEVVRHAEAVHELEARLNECTSKAAADEARAIRRSAKGFMESNEARAQQNFAIAQQLAARAETMHREAGRIAKELEWQVSRVHIKKKDWEHAEAWKQQVAQGRPPGFRAQILVASQQDWTALLSKLSAELDLEVELMSYDGITLKPGDTFICEGPRLGNIKSKQELEQVQWNSWPAAVWFNHGFDGDLRFLDLGKAFRSTPPQLHKAWVDQEDTLLREDGRWPLLIDATGSTSSFFKYSTLSSQTFHLLEFKGSLTDVETSTRLRRALLLAMLQGSAVIIDCSDVDLAVDALEEPFEQLEKGLFGKLLSRGCLFTYLLPRRFASLITPALSAEFSLDLFTDSSISNFVVAFITSLREPDPELARLFYTFRVRT